METTAPAVNKKAPDFCLPDQDGKTACLADFRGKWVVLYFYPEDDTSGCTIEAKDFTARLEDFRKAGAVILGVSPDDAESHCAFIDKYALKVRLLSDTGHKVLEEYGVWQLKHNYGKEYWGVVRSTFLINPDGIISHVWQKVSAEGHADEVQKKLSELKDR